MNDLVFDRASAKLFLDGILIALAYSGGDAGTRPEAINNPAFETERNIGPLPAGFYTGILVAAPHLGPRVWALTPEPETEMFSRSAFFLHWDNAREDFSASDGCIVPRSTTVFARIPDSFRLQVT